MLSYYEAAHPYSYLNKLFLKNVYIQIIKEMDSNSWQIVMVGKSLL